MTHGSVAPPDAGPPPARSPAPWTPASPEPRVFHPVWLIRHAPTSWTGQRWCGRADPPLDRAGRAVAASLAAELAAELPDDVIIRSSPARRARSTAAAIAAASRRVVALDPDLLEVDVGRVEGLTWEELSSREPVLASAILEGRMIDWPGGETRAEIAARAERAADAIARIAVERPVAVVSHGALIHVLREVLLDAGLGPVEPAPAADAWSASQPGAPASSPIAPPALPAGGVLRLVGTVRR